MITHVNIRVSGKVQGVFYRASTKSKADEIGVTGFVRNEPNGDVYIEGEGTTEQLAALKEWCKQGPVHAQVKQVELTLGEVVHFKTFEIKRW
jgi:acylphosphatase